MNLQLNKSGILKRGSSFSTVTEQGVKLALKNRYGSEVDLISWTTKPLDEKSDNYVAILKCVDVVYKTIDKREASTSLIVKMSSKNGVNNRFGIEFLSNVFKKEVNFYTKIIPRLNKLLYSIEHESLKVPQLYHYNLKKSKEILYLEDLRIRNFKPIKLHKTLEINHFKHITKELAKLHAAFYLYRTSNTKKNIEFAFNDFKGPSFNSNFCKMITDSVANCIEQIDEYKFTAYKLRHINFQEEIERVASSSPFFETICHGDMWFHNVLIK